MEGTFDSTELRGEREVHVACSTRKVIIDMSSRRAIRNSQIVGVILGVNPKTPERKNT